MVYARFGCLAGWFGLQVNFDSTAARKNQIRLTNRPQEFHFSWLYEVNEILYKVITTINLELF